MKRVEIENQIVWTGGGDEAKWHIMETGSDTTLEVARAKCVVKNHEDRGRWHHHVCKIILEIEGVD